jgi:hypothetical protein
MKPSFFFHHSFSLVHLVFGARHGAGSKLFIGLFCLPFFVFSAFGEPIAQSDFEHDTADWFAWNTTESSDGTSDGVLIEHVADEGADGSKGCLRIKIPEGVASENHPIRAGAALKIPSLPGSEEMPALVRIVLFARIEGDDGAPFLRIGRAGGAGTSSQIELSSEWEIYEVEISSPFPLHTLLFTPTDKSGTKISESPVLIDQVTVIEVLE